MVQVEQALCADCGGCVGACHVDCIRIERAGGIGEPGRVTLTLGASCDECNVCVLLCPTGALTSSTGPVRDWRR